MVKDIYASREPYPGKIKQRGLVWIGKSFSNVNKKNKLLSA